MELCVISSTTTTINPFQSCLTRRSLGSRLFQCDSLFLSHRRCSVLRSDGRLKKPIRPLEISCASKKFGGGGSRRSAASPVAEAEASVKEDKLPADLQVTESKAANSSVKRLQAFVGILYV